MKDLCIFKRYEKKYRLTLAQKEQLLSRMAKRLTPDPHGRSTICSLYLDTPDYRLIRQSMEARTYKEKLRLRSYGTPTAQERVFLEIKKKYKGVVYKRRERMTLAEAKRYLTDGTKPVNSQIMREIDYAMAFYRHPRPSMLLCYERDAYYDKEDPNLRITFDTGIRYRAETLDLAEGTDGTAILPADAVLMEIKTAGAMPLWLSHLLDEHGIYPTSFSKYAHCYQHHLLHKETPYERVV